MMTHLPFAKTAIEQSFTDRFAHVVSHFADHTAVIGETAPLTYRDLDRQTNGLAHQIEERLGVENEPVLLLLPHDVAMIVGIVAALKANKAYVALDPSTQPAQGYGLQEQIQARLWITTERYLPIAMEILPPQVMLLTLDASNETDHPPAAKPTADSRAGICFTSGSTGRPKGIQRTHRFMLHRTWYESSVDHLGPTARLSMLYQASFGASFADLCNALLNGAALCLFDLKAESLAQLTAWLHRTEVTHLHLPIQLYRQWLDSLNPDEQFAAIRQVTPSGQQTRSDYQRGWQHFGADCHFVSRLSSSETGLLTRRLVGRQTPLDTEVTPVGAPIPDKAVYLVDEHGQPVAAGEVGEIVVQSRYLALGYWRQPELTRQKFIPVPQTGATHYSTGDLGRLRPDGQLEFLGRKDEMVKIRGYRVELGAVEVALCALSMVQAAAVVVHKQPETSAQIDEPVLVAYVVPYTQSMPTIPMLRAALAVSLPEYMIPAYFILLDALPLLPNGKIDRKALPPLETKRPTISALFVAPHDPIETQLAAIWEEILMFNPIGVQDNFFELGGHSIAVMRLLHQMEQQFQQTVALRQFVFKPTIAHLATLLRHPQANPTATATAGPEDNLPERAVADADEPGDLVDNEELRLLYEALEDKPKIGQLRNQVQQKRIIPRGLQMSLRLPQPVALPLLYRLLQQPWAQRRYLPHQVALVHQFLAGLEQSPLAQAQCTVRCLFFGVLSHFEVRQTIFPRLQAARKIPIVGLDALAAARSRQQGVILLTCHNYQASYFRLLKLNQGAIGNMALLTSNASFDKVSAEHILYARQLELARQTLQQGEVISIAPDVNRGHGTQITVPFHGRMHPFRTSFAELALITDAQIFFVASDLQAYNRFSFQLVGPFDLGNAAMRHEERVQHLMAQYVAHLRQQWAQNPWALPWWLMGEHVAYPPVTTEKSEV